MAIAEAIQEVKVLRIAQTHERDSGARPRVKAIVFKNVLCTRPLPLEQRTEIAISLCKHSLGF